MPTKKEMSRARTLLNHFDKEWKNKYGTDYLGNSHSDIWGFRSMMDDLGYEESKKVISFYFRTDPSRGHSRDHLLYNYHLYMEELINRRKARKAERAILNKMKEDFGEG